MFYVSCTHQAVHIIPLLISDSLWLCTISPSWQKFSDCSSKVLFSPAGSSPPEDVIEVNTYPVHSLASLHLQHILYLFFFSSYKSNTTLFLSKGTIRMKDLFCSIPLQLVITAATLKCFFLKVLKLFMAYRSKLFTLWAPVNEKRRWIIALRLSFRKSADCERVMAFSFVSDLFEWLHYISHSVLWCRVKVQHRRSKVGSAYQAFYHRCILTNGNTFGTLLYLISPWWQTVNH